MSPDSLVSFQKPLMKEMKTSPLRRFEDLESASTRMFINLSTKNPPSRRDKSKFAIELEKESIDITKTADALIIFFLTLSRYPDEQVTIPIYIQIATQNTKLELTFMEGVLKNIQ